MVVFSRDGDGSHSRPWEKRLCCDMWEIMICVQGMFVLPLTNVEMVAGNEGWNQIEIGFECQAKQSMKRQRVTF